MRKYPGSPDGSVLYMTVDDCLCRIKKKQWELIGRIHSSSRVADRPAELYQFNAFARS